MRLFGLFLFVALLLASCASSSTSTPPTSSTRAAARGAVLVIADAIAAGYELCVVYVNQTGDETVKTKCLGWLKPAQEQTIAAAEGVDAWSAASQGMAGCAAKDAIAGLGAFQKGIAALGIAIPPPLLAKLEDAEALAKAFAPLCAAGEGGAS